MINIQTSVRLILMTVTLSKAICLLYLNDTSQCCKSVFCCYGNHSLLGSFCESHQSSSTLSHMLWNPGILRPLPKRSPHRVCFQLWDFEGLLCGQLLQIHVEPLSTPKTKEIEDAGFTFHSAKTYLRLKNVRGTYSDLWVNLWSNNIPSKYCFPVRQKTSNFNSS